MGKRRKRFNSEKNARSFAKKVNGRVNDLRDVEGAKSHFTVTYTPTDKTRAHWWPDEQIDFAPDEDRDFGYPNDFWK